MCQENGHEHKAKGNKSLLKFLHGTWEKSQNTTWKHSTLGAIKD